MTDTRHAMIEKPLFDDNATKTLERVAETFKQRGGQYGDTWKDCQWLAVLAVAGRMGLPLTVPQARLLAAAAFVDVKYQRLQGGYKDDSLIDGIAYTANLAQEFENHFKGR